MWQIIIIALFSIFKMAALSEPGELLDDRLKSFESYLATVTRQTMLQQFYTEERVRSEGQSGIKIVRLRRGGNRNYLTETHTGFSTAAIHDHSNNIRTVGMGEFNAVLNGVEFKTRHNDYRLFMPHTTKKDYHAVEPVPFPDVPPEVTAKGNVDQQINEMREWFKAWANQNHTVRDYRKYFKPVLCYMEGAWTKAKQNIEEPFSSDRHFIDASTWQELHAKNRFTAYTGTKSIKENLSFLPTKIMDMNGSYPKFGQWNYRILCHPLKKDLPLNRLRVVEDLSSRMMSKKDIYLHFHSRAARFQVNTADSGTFDDKAKEISLLDDLMGEIPGKDNYPGELYDEGLDAEVLNEDLTKKDVSKYHRWYKTKARDAMGTSSIHRGYNDNFMFAAKTTRDDVAGLTIEKCFSNKTNGRWRKYCYPLNQKWSYAIPLEIIYLTPLSKWNPYGLEYHGEWSWQNQANKDGRYGGCTNSKELDGTNSKNYYITPNEFYAGGNVGTTGADTNRGTVCVLDKKGNPNRVRASGVHVFLPSIKDVGVLRQRYPIYPVHAEGSSAWKELNALREIVMQKEKYSNMYWSHDDPEWKRDSIDTNMICGPSNTAKTTQHAHEIDITPDELSQCRGGRSITKTSSVANGHQHVFQIRYNAAKKEFYYSRCDDQNICWDRHARLMIFEDQ